MLLVVQYGTMQGLHELVNWIKGRLGYHIVKVVWLLIDVKVKATPNQPTTVVFNVQWMIIFIYKTTLVRRTPSIHKYMIFFSAICSFPFVT